MALILAKESLEERLSNIDNSVLNDLVTALKEHRKEIIRSPYLKDDLAPRIVGYFQSNKIPFGESYFAAKSYLYNTINKEPLKAIEKGMRVLGIPNEFLMRLDDFEKLYFFAGLENLERAPEFIGEATAYEIASVYIREGIDNMAYLHNSILESNHPARRRKVTRGIREETYKNPWTPPHSKEIRERLAKKSDIYERIKKKDEPLIREFGGLFRKEDKLNREKKQYETMEITLFTLSEQERKDKVSELEDKLLEINERIAIRLDSLTRIQLGLLAKTYGGYRLGDYQKQ